MNRLNVRLITMNNNHNKKSKKIESKKIHFQFLDVMRGFAILLMFIYHFSYDLDYFGYIQQNFNHDKVWINFRLIIVSLFLTVMGISLYLATHQNFNKKRFQQRLLLLFLYSCLVSLSSWMMYPKAMIFFGILHFITVASVLGLLFIRLGKLNLLLGSAMIILPLLLKHPFFDQPLLQWIGLMTQLPITVDYVPLFPWFGVVIIGIYLGQVLTQLPADSFLVQWQNRNPLSKTLALGGRYSLHIYMLHQPLFLGILYIISQFI